MSRPIRSRNVPRPTVGNSRYWLPVLVGAVYLATTSWRMPIFADAYGAAIEAWQWGTQGKPWLDNVDRRMLAVSQGPFPNWLFIDTGTHAVSSRTIGVVLAGVPLSVFLGPTFYVWPTALTSVVLATAAVAMIHAALRHITQPGLALAGALVFAFATPTWSVSADSLVTHSITQAAIAGAAAAASRDRWWLVGTAMAIGITGRIHLAVVAATIGLGVAATRRRPSIAMAVGLPSLMGAGLVVWSNSWRYGAPTLSGGYASYAEENLTAVDTNAALDYLGNWLGFLLSPDRGLLLWTPAVVALLVPALRAVRSAPDWTTALAVGGLAYTAVQLKINYFAGGDSFYSYRHGLELMTSLVPLMTLAWLQVRRRATRVTVVVLVWVQFAMIAPGAIAGGLHVAQTQVWTRSALMLAVLREPVLTSIVLAVAIAGSAWSLHRMGLLTTRQREPSRLPS